MSNVAAYNFSVELDTMAPTIDIIGPTATSSVSTGDVFIFLRARDDVAIDRSRLLVRNLETGDYWNGEEWDSDWAWFTPRAGTLDDPYAVMLLVDAGQYRVNAWTWDTSNNISAMDSELLTVRF